MNKVGILVVIFLLSGCSWWSGLSLAHLNPWHEEEKVVNEEKTVEVTMPMVNRYLWNAALDKLAFMGIEYQNKQGGLIVTKWKSPKLGSGERFKIIVRIEGNDFRADALDVEIKKEVKVKNTWRKAEVSTEFRIEVEQRIINQAKVLYINDENRE